LNNQKRSEKMLVKKNTGEIQEVKRAIRVLNKEIEIKLLQKSKLNPIRDFKKIEKIESLILKKDKQRIKLKQRLK
jgi:hypothetical protein